MKIDMKSERVALLEAIRAAVKAEVAAHLSQPAEPDDPLLPLRAAAELSGYSVATLHTYKSRGLLKCEKTRGRVHVKTSELVRFLNQ